MIYRYNNLTIHLEEDEVYMLNDILLFALDYDIENGNTKLTDEKRKFANRLIELTREDR